MLVASGRKSAQIIVAEVCVIQFTESLRSSRGWGV